jgi:hypothetical protein
MFFKRDGKMKIKNLRKSPLRFRTKGKENENIKIMPGEHDYPVSLKNPEHRARLIAMRDANLISFRESPPAEHVKEKENVQTASTPAKRTVTDGNTDSGGGKLSGQKSDKGK